MSAVSRFRAKSGVYVKRQNVSGCRASRSVMRGLRIDYERGNRLTSVCVSTAVESLVVENVPSGVKVALLSAGAFRHLIVPFRIPNSDGAKIESIMTR